MTRAVFFDMGGTLDGDGVHWLDRFAELYADAGVVVPADELRRAFDDAERRSAIDETIATSDLHTMIERHVDWQLASLTINDRTLGRELVSSFVKSIRAAAVTNARVLSSLYASGLRIGVVSNGCGNVSLLCDELGYTPFLSVVVDSRRAGLFKPDPSIYLHAADRIGMPPPVIMMVGDSFDRDIRPAKQTGMETAWLEGPDGRECPEPALVDLRLRTLTELPEAINTRIRTVA